MQITVYADLLFLTNLLINLFLLQLTHKILHDRSAFFRRLLLSVLGAFYAVCVYTKSLAFLGKPGFQILFYMLTVFFAFRCRSTKHFLRSVLVFFSVHILFGGLCYMLFFMTNVGIRLGATLKNGIFYLHVPYHIVLLSVPLGYACLCALDAVSDRLNTQKHDLHSVEIILENQPHRLCALLDTGNALFDPMTHLPVVIVESKAVSLPAQPMRYIPYRTLAGETRALPAVYQPQITVDGQPAGACMLALTDAQLSADGQFNALLHASILRRL